jgi:hypothetical protein
MYNHNMSSSAQVKSKKKTWIDLIGESVYTDDDANIGDIDAVNRDFVVVRRGLINVQYYFIPITKVEGWDGNVLWLKLSEAEVVMKYQRDETLPHPSRYYIKDYPGYTTAYYPNLAIIRPRYSKPLYEPIVLDNLYKCDLCGESNINTEDALGNHVRINH